jgi:hypothetical protein
MEGTYQGQCQVPVQFTGAADTLVDAGDSGTESWVVGCGEINGILFHFLINTD